MGNIGTLLNFAIAGAALAASGPYWAVIAFLGVALVRIAMDASALRRANESLMERVAMLEGHVELDPLADDAPPQSGTRPARALKRAS